MTDKDTRLGPSGVIAGVFQRSELTPLICLLGIVLGIVAVMITPKEEEPQIDVTMADVFVGFPGASAKQVEQLIAIPGEQILSEMSGVEHIYTVSRAGQAVLTVQFNVGIPRQQALVRLYNKIQSNKDWFPPSLGVMQPLVKPRSIDDVPIMTLTLYDEDTLTSAEQLTALAHRLEIALKQIPGTRDIKTHGAARQHVNARVEVAKLAGYGLTVADIKQAIDAGNNSAQESRIIKDGLAIPFQAGGFLNDLQDLKQLVVGTADGKPIYFSDVATIADSGSPINQSLLMGGLQEQEVYPAVTIAISKKPGENAIDITDAVRAKLAELKNKILPVDVEVAITRDYGKTATDKFNQLVSDLISATISVIVLVLLTMGWRQAAIVGTAVLVTLLLTLVFSWFWGFTLNRVSLFALIFSIGILVDDGIVITENIHRRIRNSTKPLPEVIPKAVDEVGSPTIMATLTIMAALIPMAFVSGLMGPYMSPIPINASAGMVFSQLIAFIVAPWLALRLLNGERGKDSRDDSDSAAGVSDKLKSIFEKILRPLLGKQHRGRRALFGAGVFILLLAVMLLPVFKGVVLKMLPFDNKSELQVVVDMPDDAAMEETQRLQLQLGNYLSTVDEVENWQAYAGTASPINFNGLVRQYYLRSQPSQGDIQVNLKNKEDRQRSSHQIAREIRADLVAIAKPYGAALKVVEVPPGPPVFAPIVAEIYGGTGQQQIELAETLLSKMAQVDGLVDTDTSVTDNVERWLLEVDRQRAAQLGIAQSQVTQALSLLINAQPAGYLHKDTAKYAVPILVQLEDGAKAQRQQILSLQLRAQDGTMIPLSTVAQIETDRWPRSRYHKDLKPVTYVEANMAGETDSPIYGMFELVSLIEEMDNPPEQFYINQPSATGPVAIKWDGEWQITYETFRDMGLAYSVGIFMIFVLLVAQFRSYLMPLIIMSPIPLTLVGILPGHWLLGKEFTATSMIGMIALAGIIVRNSILLVVFIRQLIDEGYSLEDAVVLSGAVRLKPIALTAVSAMIGAYFILSDPIFNGLAISLIFGLAASTILTVVVVPLLYYGLFNFLADSKRQ
ncbi:efflux RND transporter permease subunit [Idiomarina seosinensis]|uniref:Multidrug transporter AcrB n=1 Tax=Idiomarina seosinensis TaxID=281739 RepID=A0A432ZDK4_9GAMM|nr:efflux RND transporter permease subunit [Idiomarina seosinensis]RUO76001.1 multidrug transporter AcrB [Idiomarina seosinensis]